MGGTQLRRHRRLDRYGAERWARKYDLTVRQVKKACVQASQAFEYMQATSVVCLARAGYLKTLEDLTNLVWHEDGDEAALTLCNEFTHKMDVLRRSTGGTWEAEFDKRLKRLRAKQRNKTYRRTGVV